MKHINNDFGNIVNESMFLNTNGKGISIDRYALIRGIQQSNSIISANMSVSDVNDIAKRSEVLANNMMSRIPTNNAVSPPIKNGKLSNMGRIGASIKLFMFLMVAIKSLKEYVRRNDGVQLAMMLYAPHVDAEFDEIMKMLNKRDGDFDKTLLRNKIKTLIKDIDNVVVKITKADRPDIVSATDIGRALGDLQRMRGGLLQMQRELIIGV